MGKPYAFQLRKMRYGGGCQTSRNHTDAHEEKIPLLYFSEGKVNMFGLKACKSEKNKIPSSSVEEFLGSIKKREPIQYLKINVFYFQKITIKISHTLDSVTIWKKKLGST